MWEDDANRRGGKWIVNFDKRQRMGSNAEVSAAIRLAVETKLKKCLFGLNRLTTFGLKLF